MSEGARPLLHTLLRFGVVGVCNNLLGYGLYLGLTFAGIGPKTTMSLLYAIGASWGFFSNRRWVFDHQGAALGSAIRYWLAHGIGYGINFVMLYTLVDVMGYPHRVVQAAAILVVAACLFVMFHFFVFPRARTATAP